jgi:hypothetical protein
MTRRLAVVVLTLSALSLVPSAARADEPPMLNWSALLPGLSQGYEPSSADECLAGRTGCVDAVVRELRRRFDLLAANCDHNAVFALSYLRTTEEYRRAIEDPAFFEDTSFVNHEDAVFAAYYFDAVDAWRTGGAVPPAWRIAFEAAEDRAVSAAGDLVLGINAHVQRDLPFVLAAIGLVKPDGSSRKRDHDRVNRILNRVMGPLIREIAARFDPTVDDASLPTVVDDVLTFQAIPTWREVAWRNAERLAAATTAADRARVAASIETYAASQALLLRTATAYPLGLGRAAREAYCADRG